MTDMSNRRGLLVILSSPSGAGKSTLARRLMEWDPGLSFSVSATTRAPRTGEEHGREYYFLSEDEFKRMAANGEMLEHANSALGATFTGYKGGEYTMHEYTDCWIAEYGKSDGDKIGPTLKAMWLATAH